MTVNVAHGTLHGYYLKSVKFAQMLTLQASTVKRSSIAHIEILALAFALVVQVHCCLHIIVGIPQEPVKLRSAHVWAKYCAQLLSGCCGSGAGGPCPLL